MGSVKLMSFEFPGSPLDIKFPEREKEINLLVRYVQRNLFQKRVQIEPLS